MNVSLLDLAERVGWTFAQALAGSIAAGGAAVSLGAFDWRAAVVGAGTAAGLCLLKVLGVGASQSLPGNPGAGAAPVPPDSAPPANPAVNEKTLKTFDGAGQVSAQITTDTGARRDSVPPPPPLTTPPPDWVLRSAPQPPPAAPPPSFVPTADELTGPPTAAFAPPPALSAADLAAAGGNPTP